MASLLPTSWYSQLTENGDYEIALEAVDSTEEIIKNKDKKNKEEGKSVVSKQQRNEYRVFKAETMYLVGRYEELLKFLDEKKRYIAIISVRS